MAVAGFGQGTSIVLSENAVAVAGNQVIAPVADWFRKNGVNTRGDTPEGSQFAIDGDGGSGAIENSFCGLPVVLDQIESIQAFRSEAVFLQDGAGEFAL